MTMAQYYYNSDYMHCSQEQCPKHEKCWRFELGKMCKGIASFYMPDKDKDLSNCDYFIDKKEYKIK